MKTIEFPSNKSDEFKGILKSLVGFNQDEGFTIDQVRTGIKVLDKIEATGDEITLEDAEHAFVVNRVNSAKWKIVSQDVLDFVDAITGAA